MGYIKNTKGIISTGKCVLLKPITLDKNDLHIDVINSFLVLPKSGCVSDDYLNWPESGRREWIDDYIMCRKANGLRVFFICRAIITMVCMHFFIFCTDTHNKFQGFPILNGYSHLTSFWATRQQFNWFSHLKPIFPP